MNELAVIVLLLFFVYYVLGMKQENFSQKECSEKSINEATLSYIFGTPKSTK